MNIINKSSAKGGLDIPIYILTFFIVGWLNNGILRIIPAFNAYMVFTLYFIWFILVNFSKKSFLPELTKQTVWLVLLIFSCIFSSVLIYHKLEAKVLEWCFLFIIYSIFLYFTKYPNNKFMKFTFIFLLIDKILIAINTMRLLDTYPDLSRMLASGFASIEDFVLNPYLLAGYGFVYSSVAILIFFKIDFKHIKKRYYVLLISYMMVSIILLFRASYMISLLMLVFFFVYTTFLKKHEILKSVFVIILVMVAYRFLVELIYLSADVNFLTYQIKGRLLLLGDFLSGKSVGGTTFAARGGDYLISTKVFVDNVPNFFLGVYEKAAALNVVGTHSEWLDDLALLGIFRFSFLVLFIRQAVKKLLIHTHNRKAVGYVFTYIFFVGFVNPIMYIEVFLAVFICTYFAKTIVQVDDNMLEKKERKYTSQRRVLR